MRRRVAWRLDGRTKDRPKALVEFGSKPLKVPWKMNLKPKSSMAQKEDYEEWLLNIKLSMVFVEGGTFYMTYKEEGVE